MRDKHLTLQPEQSLMFGTDTDRKWRQGWDWRFSLLEFSRRCCSYLVCALMPMLQFYYSHYISEE